MTGAEILDRKLADGTTVREFLKACLSALIDEGEAFSGKRPLGNSGWEAELAHAIGAVDANDPEDVDFPKTRTMMLEAIKAL